MTDDPDGSGQALIETAQAFGRGKVLNAAVRLGVADVLGGGPLATDEIAAALEADPPATARLLRALAAMGVLRSTDGNRYELTAAGQPLRRDAEGSVWASIVFWADLLDDFWSYLPECVRAGGRTPAHDALKAEGVTTRWEREPDPRAIFHAVFAEPTPEDMAPFVDAHDLAPHRTVTDLGGGGGALLIAILRRHPGARGVLVDRPRGLDLARANLEAAGLTARVEVIGADLLEEVPEGGGAYILKSVLHGFDDTDALDVLGRCRRAMAEDGELLVIEVVLPTAIDGGDDELVRMVLSDINMLAVTGGQERTEAAWRDLLGEAGFTVTAIAPTTTPQSIIVCRPSVAD